MAINTGVNVSKLVAYAVLAPNPGVNVSKLNSYAILAPNAGVNVSKLISYAVLDAGTAPVWPSFSFANGYVSVPYSQSFTLSGSVPITFTLVSGSLPPGLSLSSVNSNTGKVAGTPTTAGTYSFTLRASNAYGAVDQPFMITILTIGGGGGSFTWIA